MIIKDPASDEFVVGHRQHMMGEGAHVMRVGGSTDNAVGAAHVPPRFTPRVGCRATARPDQLWRSRLRGPAGRTWLGRENHIAMVA